MPVDNNLGEYYLYGIESVKKIKGDYDQNSESFIHNNSDNLNTRDLVESEHGEVITKLDKNLIIEQELKQQLLSSMPIKNNENDNSENQPFAPDTKNVSKELMRLLLLELRENQQHQWYIGKSNNFYLILLM
ncbi:702_t:CDS:2 [Acaulospora colombiana]|uniref:702_t:CDS:1 n=1 Tax=Acaulospora colombiana TaxID=27376 RepID=A0ACA9L0U0_9GLOM|nr:702_t:CDS:2 [Acaulospora colombiana]